jgi:hypothetical protein
MFRWTGRKGFAAIVLFFILTVLVELLMVYSFQMLGLVDPAVLVGTLSIPGTNLSLVVSISPLLHLLPLSVIIVLLASWMYLTKYSAFIQQQVETGKRGPPPSQRMQESRRFKSLRRLSRRVTRRLQRAGRAVRTGFEKIRGVSYISQRLHFARAAVRSALMVLLVFIVIAFLTAIIEYPDLIHSWTVNLYRGSPALLNFVVGIGQSLRGISDGVGSALFNAFAGAGPGFRQSLVNAGTALTGSIVRLDVAGKYVIAQNLAAWISAVIALVYGTYASSRPSRRGKGR